MLVLLVMNHWHTSQNLGYHLSLIYIMPLYTLHTRNSLKSEYYITLQPFSL